MKVALKIAALALWIGVPAATSAHAETLVEHCERSTFSRDMDCQCVAEREDELRQWASETHATGNNASRIASDQRLLDMQKQRLASETRPERRDALQKGVDALEERIALLSVPLDSSVHQYRTLYTYFEGNLECRSYDKIYANAYANCESRSRNLGDAMEAYCTCVAETTADRWAGPEMPKEPVPNPMITCRG